MKKSNKKWMMGIISLVFVALMMVNVSVSIDDMGSTTDICLDGITTMAVAQGTEDPGGGGGWASCRYYTGFGQYYGTSCWSCSVVSDVGDGQVGLCQK